MTAPKPRWLNITKLDAKILSRVFCENKSSVPGVSNPLVASVMGQLGFHLGRHSRVHDKEPKRWNQAQQDGRGIAQRQRGLSSWLFSTWYFFADLKWWSLCRVSSYSTILPMWELEFQEWCG